MKNQEERIYPPTVWQGDTEVPYDCYLRARQNNKAGDILCASAGAPGVGYIKHRITRIDDTGVYGVEIENTIWVPDGEYYR